MVGNVRSKRGQGISRSMCGNARRQEDTNKSPQLFTAQGFHENDLNHPSPMCSRLMLLRARTHVRNFENDMSASLLRGPHWVTRWHFPSILSTMHAVAHNQILLHGSLFCLAARLRQRFRCGGLALTKDIFFCLCI